MHLIIQLVFMEALIKTWKTNRRLYSDFFRNYGFDQLNKVPPGFNNNLIWNIGHVIAAQQSLIYRLSAVPMIISDDLFERYKPGTKPGGPVSQDEMDELHRILVSTIDETENDLKTGKFKDFKERTTATGFHLGSLHDALEFNNYHEGLHLGMMMSIRKFI
jgi:hypothetical protein